MFGSDSRLQTVPARTTFDYALAAAKAASFVSPFMGPGVVLFDLITAPLREKRLTDWCEDLRLCLNELSEKVSGLTLESLMTDQFLSAFAHAAQSILKTHQAEKREALRNAVLNVTLTKAPTEDMQLIFLNLIDRFTPTHLQMLSHIENRASKPQPQTEFNHQIVQDLNNQGLLMDKRLFAARNRDYIDLLASGS